MNSKDKIIIVNSLNIKIKNLQNKINYFEKKISQLYDLQDKIWDL